MFNSFSTDTEPSSYNNYGNPPNVSFAVKNVTIGPAALNDASEKLNDKFWATYFEPGTKDIILDDLIGGTTAIVNEPLGIKRIGLAFDQNANDAYAWITDTNILKIRFFDGSIPDDVILTLGTAQDVVITMDMKYQPPNPVSDILVFYIRDKAIFYRLQRDKYSIEYTTPVTDGANQLIDSGIRTDYRFQVQYI